MKKMIALTFALAAAAALADTTNLVGQTFSGYTAVSLGAGTNTMIGVVYQACGTSSGTIAATDLVSTYGLTGVASKGEAGNAAKLLVLPSGATPGAGAYEEYYLNSSTGWTPTADDGGVSYTETTLAAGDAVFLSNPSTTTAYIKGGVISQVSKPTTTCTPGYNLVSSVSTEAYSLGDLTFTTPNGAARMPGGAADKIILQNPPRTFWYYSKSGTSEWRDMSSNAVDLDDITLAAGEGFWYVVPTEGSNVTVSR